MSYWNFGIRNEFLESPDNCSAQKLFGALFGHIFPVPKSVSQSARFSPDTFEVFVINFVMQRIAYGSLV